MEKTEKEVRVLNLDLTKLRVEQRDDGQSKISGYAAVFNSDSEDMGFVEQIKPGAFKSALRKSDVRALFNHDANLIFGRSGVNLKLKEDDHGLYMEVSPLMTGTYRMVAENISAGLVTQQSFAFTVAEDEWNEDYTKRTIHKIHEVFDVSPVTYPAYANTDVALRCRQSAMEKKTANNPDNGDPTINPESGNRSNGGETPTSHEPQTAEELEERYQSIKNRRKGF